MFTVLFIIYRELYVRDEKLFLIICKLIGHYIALVTNKNNKATGKLSLLQTVV